MNSRNTAINQWETNKTWFLDNFKSALSDILKIRKLYKEKPEYLDLNSHIMKKGTLNIILKLINLRYFIDINWEEHLEKALDLIKKGEKVMIILPSKNHLIESSLLIAWIQRYCPELYTQLLPLIQKNILNVSGDWILQRLIHMVSIFGQQTLSKESSIDEINKLWKVIFIYPETNSLKYSDIEFIKFFTQKWGHIIKCEINWTQSWGVRKHLQMDFNSCGNIDELLGKSTETTKNEEIYNKHYHKQHIRNWMHPTALIQDDPFKILYHINQGAIWERRELMLWILDSFSNIIWQNKEFQKNMLSLFEQLNQWKSVLIVTNHATFLNFPLIISELQKFAKTIWYENILEDTYTILWPALVTQDQKNYIQAISNLLKTIPETPNSNIPWFEKQTSFIRKKFLRNLLRLRSKKWKIFLLAPTGTRDIVQRQDDNVQWIYFKSDELVQWSLSIVKSFAKDWLHTFVIWVNESQLKNPSKVLSWSNEWTSGNVIMSMEEIPAQQALQHLENKTFMQILADNVKDESGRILWKATEKPEETKRKNMIPQNTKYTDFPDTIKKKLLRRFFYTLKSIKEKVKS